MDILSNPLQKKLAYVSTPPHLLYIGRASRLLCPLYHMIARSRKAVREEFFSICLYLIQPPSSSPGRAVPLAGN